MYIIGNASYIVLTQLPHLKHNISKPFWNITRVTFFSSIYNYNYSVIFVVLTM